MTPAELDREVQDLEGLDLEGLRSVWRQRLGLPPKLRSPELVRLMLAWRIQAQAFGGLDIRARRLLRQSGTKGAGDNLGDGARIVREWHGVMHVVEQSGAQYRWEARLYPSLSAVAKAITGTKCNGPKFFGLRTEGAKP